jgi:hypothetical protein
MTTVNTSQLFSVSTLTDIHYVQNSGELFGEENPLRTDKGNLGLIRERFKCTILTIDSRNQESE